MRKGGCERTVAEIREIRDYYTGHKQMAKHIEGSLSD